MADNTAKVIDQTGAEVLDPKKALSEQTLAVDLAGVELDRAIATAHKFPRSIDVVLKRIRTLALYNRESAENCVYALPRGKKPIIGPSIGFANVVQQCWGNNRTASRIVYIDTRQKVVIAEGGFLDLETNAQSLVPVNRRIVDSKGRLYNDDMQIVTGMAAASIARRNAILQGVARGIWFPIFAECLALVRGDLKTFEEHKASALKAFAQFGVKPEQVFMVLELKGEADLTLEHIPMLRGMYKALADGSTTVEEMFDPRRTSGRGGFEVVDNPLGEAMEAESGDPRQVPAETVSQDTDPAAGLGEPAEPEAAETAPAASGATQAAQAGSPAAETTAEAAVTHAVTETAPTGSAAAPAADPRSQLRSEDEYLSYWEGFCNSCTSLAALKQQWNRDRGVRTNCRVVAEAFAEAERMRLAAEQRLGG